MTTYRRLIAAGLVLGALFIGYVLSRLATRTQHHNTLPERCGCWCDSGSRECDCEECDCERGEHE